MPTTLVGGPPVRAEYAPGLREELRTHRVVRVEEVLRQERQQGAGREQPDGVAPAQVGDRRGAAADENRDGERKPPVGVSETRVPRTETDALSPVNHEQQGADNGLEEEHDRGEVRPDRAPHAEASHRRGPVRGVAGGGKPAWFPADGHRTQTILYGYPAEDPMNRFHASSRALRIACIAASAAASPLFAQASGAGFYGGVGLGGGLGWPGQQWSNPSLFVPGSPGFPGRSSPSGLREVDPGFTDFEPLRTSMYFVGSVADLRTPTDFDRLFVGADGRYYRMIGSLVAAFDRSSYVAGPDGVYPVVPAGTVYYTGGLPPEALGEPATRNFPRVESRVGGPVRASAGAAPNDRVASWTGFRSASDIPPRAEREETPGPPTMATDEAYRASRLGIILRNASPAR